MNGSERIAVWQRWKSRFDVRIVYILDGDQTGRVTAGKLEKWRTRSKQRTGTLAYAGASELIVYVGPSSRRKKEASQGRRSDHRRRKGRRSLADCIVPSFPETLDFEERELNSMELLHFRVSTGQEMTGMAMCFVAGWISRFCSPLCDFRIVSADKHAGRVCKFLARMGFLSQVVGP